MGHQFRRLLVQFSKVCPEFLGPRSKFKHLHLKGVFRNSFRSGSGKEVKIQGGFPILQPGGRDEALLSDGKGGLPGGRERGGWGRRRRQTSESRCACSEASLNLKPQTLIPECYALNLEP